MELIQDNPYSKITIKKICQTAEISLSTFYLHFDSINDVLNAVLDDAIMTICEGTMILRKYNWVFSSLKLKILKHPTIESLENLSS